MFATASNSAPNEIRVFSESGELLQAFKRNLITHLVDIEWSPDGKWLACGSHGSYSLESGVKVWNTESWENRLVADAHAGHYSIEWEPNGERLAMIAKYGSDAHFYFTIHSGDSLEIERTIGLPWTTNGTHRLAWSPRTQWMAVTWNGTIYLYDIDAGALVQTIGCNDEIRSTAWSADGRRIATALEDGTTRIWSFDGEPITSIRTHPRMPDSQSTATALNPDGTSVAVRWADRRNWNTQVFDVASGVRRHQANSQHCVGIHASELVWSPAGNLLATASWDVDGEQASDLKIALWNPTNGTKSFLRGHETLNWARFAWSGDGTRLASSGSDKTIRVWDVANAQQIALADAPGNALDLRFSPDATTVVGQFMDSLLFIDAETGKCIRQAAARANDWNALGIWFTPEGDLASMMGRSLVVRDGKTGLLIREREPETPLGSFRAVVSPDGTRLAFQTWRDGHSLEIRDTSTFEPLWSSVVVSDEHMAAFTPAGQMLNPEPEIVEQLAWVIENPDGTLSVMSRQEFLARIGSDAEPASIPAPASVGNSTDATSNKWIELFNGRDLTGWTKQGEAEWNVQDSAISVRSDKTGSLVCKQPFKNFDLELDVFAAPLANGGVRIHTIDPTSLEHSGYEVQVAGSQDPGEKNFTGGVYGKEIVFQQAADPTLDNRWVKLRVRVEDALIRTWVDGSLAADFSGDPLRLTGGHIALHSWEWKSSVSTSNSDPPSATLLKYRNLRIREVVSK